MNNYTPIPTTPSPDPPMRGGTSCVRPNQSRSRNAPTGIVLSTTQRGSCDNPTSVDLTTTWISVPSTTTQNGLDQSGSSDSPTRVVLTDLPYQSGSHDATTIFILTDLPDQSVSHDSPMSVDLTDASRVRIYQSGIPVVIHVILPEQSGSHDSPMNIIVMDPNPDSEPNYTPFHHSPHTSSGFLSGGMEKVPILGPLTPTHHQMLLPLRLFVRDLLLEMVYH